MPSLVFSTSGGSKVVREYDKIKAKQREMSDAIEGNTRKSIEFDRTVTGIIRRNETAQDRYNRLVAAAGEAFDRSKISANEYQGEVERINQEMEESQGRFRQFKEDSESAFESDGLDKFALALGGIVLAGKGVTDILSDIIAERERIQQFSAGGERSLASLSQLASSREQFKEFVKQARDFHASGASESIESAAGAVFALQSAGAGQEIEVFRDLARSGTAADTALLARAAQTVRSGFGGEAGTFEDVIDRAFAASAFAPASAESLTEATARSAGAARALGFSPDETFAATAISAEASGTAERGGTRIESLLRSFEKIDQSLVGGSIADTVENISKLGLSGGELQKLFGTSEAVSGFRSLAGNFERFKQATAAVTAADASNLTRQQLTFSRADPAIAAEQFRREQENQRDITLEGQNIGIRQSAILGQRARADADLAEQFGDSRLGDIYRAGFRALDATFNAIPGLGTGEQDVARSGLQKFPEKADETNRHLQTLIKINEKQLSNQEQSETSIPVTSQ